MENAEEKTKIDEKKEKIIFDDEKIKEAEEVAKNLDEKIIRIEKLHEQLNEKLEKIKSMEWKGKSQDITTKAETQDEKWAREAKIRYAGTGLDPTG